MITQDDIDERNEMLARLTPIAALVGIPLDESDPHLVRLLSGIATYRERAGVGSSSGTATGSMTAQAEALSKTIHEAKAKANPTGVDLGDQVVAQLVAMGAIAAEPAAVGKP